MRMMERAKLLKTSWNSVASAYDRELAPRFQPWLRDTLHELLNASIPDGCVYAPCCGSGDELVALSKALPDCNDVLGIDLSDEMVRLSLSKICQANLQHRVQAVVGDACAAPAQRDCAAVFSVFGLQQLQPAPEEALKQWLSALKPGGAAAICYWPRSCEDDGPWQAYDQAVAGHRQESAAAAETWEDRLIPAALQVPGIHLLADKPVQHKMQWPSFATFWEVMTEAGPWNARLMQFGQEYMTNIRQQLEPMYKGQPLVHHPRARLLVFKRVCSAVCMSCL